jgi:hypothetical protein
MLQNSKIKEASGICRSVLHPNVYWTHNDSGNAAVFFAIDSTGKNLGEFPLQIKPADAEDCSSAMVNGVPTLIFGDFGDNKCSRGTYHIYVVTEPNELTPQSLPAQKISFKYPDGLSRNCEACSLLSDGTITIVTKSWPQKSGPTMRYTIRSWLSGDEKTTISAGERVSSSYGTITGMDTMEKEDGVFDVLLGIKSSIGYAHIINRDSKAYRNIRVSSAVQREGICFNHDGSSVIVVSERDRKISVNKI